MPHLALLDQSDSVIDFNLDVIERSEFVTAHVRTMSGTVYTIAKRHGLAFVVRSTSYGVTDTFSGLVLDVDHEGRLEFRDGDRLMIRTTKVTMAEVIEN